MEKKIEKNAVINYIESYYKSDKPILLKELYKVFSYINENTIRSIIYRYMNDGKLVRIDSGIYGTIKENSLYKKSYVSVFSTIEYKYLKPDKDRVIGYITGINFANRIGLTTQTAAVQEIRSNIVSNKKREIKIKNNRLIIDAPRIPVNKNNYKLLQILDILTEFDLYSEYDFKEASYKMKEYLKDIKMKEDYMEKIVSSYPLIAQVGFYKMGGQYVVAK